MLENSLAEVIKLLLRFDWMRFSFERPLTKLPILEIYSTLLPEHGRISLTSPPACLSQRIAAVDLASGLQYFGRSIHGTMDMNNDGSVDLAVGSLGAAVLLWLVSWRGRHCA